MTAKRRAERKQFKLDRAQAIATAAAEAEAAFAEGRIISAEESRVLIPSAATWKPSNSTRNVVSPRSEPSQEETDLSAEPLEDMEHMQLTLAEAFFLAWALDCLTIYHPKTVRLRTCACAICPKIFTIARPNDTTRNLGGIPDRLPFTPSPFIAITGTQSATG